MRGISTTVALLRRARVERGILLLLFALTAVTSFVVAAGPRLFARTADEGLRYELAHATAVQRDVEFTMASRIPAAPDAPFGRVTAQGDELWDQLPASLRSIVSGRGFLVESPRFVLASPPNFTTMVTLAYQDGVGEQVRFVEGRSPARAAPPTDPSAPPRLEIALSRSTAATTKIRVGDRLLATSDGSDKLVQRIVPRPSKQVELDVVGLYEVDDPTAEFWFDDPRLAEPSIGGTDDFPIAFATGLFAPEAYADVEAMGLPTLYHWRFLTHPSLIDADRLETLIPDLRRMESATFVSTEASDSLVYRSGLLGVVERFGSLRAGAEAALSIAVLGPLAAAAGAVGMVAVILVRRRRTPLVLARARGASPRQLLAAQSVEGLLVTAPAACLGSVAASIAIAGPSSLVSATGVLAVTVGVTALTVAATWPIARRARGELEREDAPAAGPRPRRLVLDATAIAIAVGATWLLRERTLTAATQTGGETTFDPFLAAAPVLVGIAVALAVIRLYPLPVRALGAFTARWRGLVPVLGLRWIGRHPSAAYLPLLVLTLTVAIGVFSSVVQTTIERGQLEASWGAVGADYRIDAPPGVALPDRLDVAGVPGIEAVAPVLSTSVSDAAEPVGPTLLHAVDPSAYAAVVAGTPASVVLPPSVAAAPAGPGIGAPEHPIPVLASMGASGPLPGRSMGDDFALVVLGRQLTFRVVGLAESFPGISSGSAFAVAPLASVTAAYGGTALRPNAALARGPASAGPGLEAAVAGTGAALTSRHARYASLHDAPLIGAVGVGFGIALLVAAAYAALTVVAVVSLDAQRRARETAYLRTLGLTDRQLVGLTVVEHAPPLALALAVGVALGFTLAWLLAPGIGLASFIEPVGPVVLRVDLAAVVAVMAANVLVVTVAIAASSWMARRLDAAEALRMGEA